MMNRPDTIFIRLNKSVTKLYSSWRDYFKILFRFEDYLKIRLNSITVAIIFAIGSTVVRLAEPWPLKFIFDNILLDQQFSGFMLSLVGPFTGSKLSLLGLFIGILILLALFSGIFYYFLNVNMSKIGQEVASDIRQDVYLHLQKLSLRFHTKSKSGDLLMRLTHDIAMLRQLLVQVLLSAASESVVMISMILILFVMNWQLTAVTLIVLPILFYVSNNYRKKIKQAADKQRKREGAMASTMQQTLSAIKVVQGFAQEKYEADKFKRQNRRSLRAGLRTSKLEAHMNLRVELALALSIAVVLAIGVDNVLSQELTPGDLLVFIAYVRGFYRPLRRLSRTTKRGAKIAASGERVLELLENIPDVRDLPGAVPAPKFDGEIIFDNVTFGYTKESTVLKNLNLHIKPGEKVAIVGSTGAGKSTLVALISRFYDPMVGRILMGKRDIREYTINSLRKQITLVLQEPMLFGTTIRENIAYSRPDASMEKIVKTAKLANIHDFIVSLPEGYETIIGESGSTISGGQRQCISIARALLRRSPIVIMDEPTVGLDAWSENMVLEGLRNLMHGRTVIMIAHQFRTVQDADRIIVIDDNRIVAEGTHEELIRTSNLYNQLYGLQVNGNSSVQGIGGM